MYSQPSGGLEMLQNRGRRNGFSSIFSSEKYRARWVKPRPDLDGGQIGMLFLFMLFMTPVLYQKTLKHYQARLL